MDIIEFVEKICGVKLFAYQKEFLRMHEKARKEFGGDYKIILGRSGNVYMVAGKETKMNEVKLCKYYNPHMDTLLEYCKCLYKLKDCGCGGSLHILLDDDNIDTDDILFCLNECVTHPEKEESELGALICKEYLKLSFEERLCFDSIWNGMPKECLKNNNCKNCLRMKHFDNI